MNLSLNLAWTRVTPILDAPLFSSVPFSFSPDILTFHWFLLIRHPSNFLCCDVSLFSLFSLLSLLALFPPRSPRSPPLSCFFRLLSPVSFVSPSLRLSISPTRKSCSAMARIGGASTPYVAKVLIEGSPEVALALYGVMCIVTAVVCLYLPIETRGRPMQVRH